MLSDIPYWVYLLVFNLACGALSAFIARFKGRSVLLWFLVGLVFQLLAVIVVVFSANLARIEEMEIELRRVRRELDDLRFEREVTIGSAQASSICLGCGHFSDRYSVCDAFGRDIRDPIIACDRFAADGGVADDGADSRDPEPEGPSIPPSPARS